MRSVVPSLLAMALCSNALLAQPRVVITNRGSGQSARAIERVISAPYRLVTPDTARFMMARVDSEPQSILVLGRSAAIAGTVTGDVVVVGGDLFLRPGVNITGRAVAIGGGVYSTTLGDVLGGIEDFRDETFDIAQAGDEWRLSHRALVVQASGFELPGFRGVRLPSYDRVNGVSLPAGAALTFANGRGYVDVLATYRSDLGKIDPSLSATFQLTNLTRAELTAGRGTFTNDAWIWGDFINSLSTLVLGTDTRNYFRADRVQLTLHRPYARRAFDIEPFVGARLEQSWAVGPFSGETGAPWSMFRRTDSLGMRRPNPAFPDGELASALAGTTLTWDASGLRAVGTSLVEVGFGDFIAAGVVESGSFAQVTTDLQVDFPVVRNHQYRFDAHWVATAAGPAPPQRFVYFGGSGTMPFLDLLEQGGDQLLFLDQRYLVPLDSVRIRVLGSPTVYLRHRLGSAGLGGLPAFEQALGVGVSVRLARVEVNLNPANGDVRVSAGLSMAR